MKFAHVLLMLAVAPAGITFAQDSYQWLRDESRQSPQVLEYLQQHNRLTDEALSPVRDLQHSLLSQWQTMTVSKADEPWQSRLAMEWKLSSQRGELSLLRRANAKSQAQLVYSFAPRQAQAEYYQIGAWAVSRDQSKLLFSEDIDGSERYQLVEVDLKQGGEKILATGLDQSMLYSADGQYVYLIRKDPATQRPSEIRRLTVADLSEQRIWQEERADWLLSFYQASDPRYALLQSNNENSSEQKLLDLQSGEVRPIRPAQAGLEYYADVAKDTLFIKSNLHGQARLYTAPLKQPSEWTRFTQALDGLQQFYLFADALVAVTQQKADSQVLVFDYAGELKKRLPLNQQGQVAWVSRNGDFASNQLRLRSMSMTTPPMWQELNVKTLDLVTLSRDVYQNYHAERYVSEQVIAHQNGVEVPITLAYRKDKLNAHSPVILYGYGAYGFTMKPYFMPQIISLLDQGAIYAIAHVRGGGYYGDAWHQAGRGEQKRHSMDDFVAAAKSLQHYQQGERLVYAMGSSAGGTLVAGALNQAPQAFAGAVLKVPFVDVVNSMTDTSLPLTEQQYGEWGNPQVESALKAMQAYDPYGNIKAVPYPPLLVQIGLNDQRVPYWEGAKYLSKLAELSTGQGPYLLQTDFESGHSSDRRKALEQQALEYAFLISLFKTSSQAEQK